MMFIHLLCNSILISTRAEMIKKIGLLFLIILLGVNSAALAVSASAKKAVLEKIAKRTFMYFWKEANPRNGLIRDASTNQNASISVVGFGLAGLCIAVENGWITRKEGYKRALITLRSFSPKPIKGHKTRVAKEHGHPYHWVSIFDGTWPMVGGIHSTDTAVFLAGVITVGDYFKGTEVSRLAEAIYEQVDWSWFYNAKQDSLYLGWTPQGGHFGYYQMNEIGLLPTLLAISSPTHPIPQSSWFTLGQRYFKGTYQEYDYFGDAAAFTHQWPFCFIDPMMKKDFFADYAQNNREFALAQRQWCIDHRGEGYAPNFWGLSVALGPDKYGNYGAPVIENVPLYYNGQDDDGTITPAAAIGFLPFTPDKSWDVIDDLYTNYGRKIFNKYGFNDAINLSVDYFSTDYLGINQGASLLILDNYLHGTVWKYFSENRFIKAGLAKIGFSGIIDNFDHAGHSPAYAEWSSLSKGVTLAPTDEFCKEGRHALKIVCPEAMTSARLSVRPRQNKIGHYRYLALWQSGASKINIALRGEKQGIYNLRPAGRVKDSAWTLVYYKLPGVRSSEISSLMITVKTVSKKAYLDDIHLANSTFLVKPLAPDHVEAVAGKHTGEVILSWQAQASDVTSAGYRIKYATAPFTSKLQFDRNNNIVDYHNIMRPGQYKTIIGGLEAGRQYYFGISALNPAGLSSSVGTAGVITPSKQTLIFDFDPNELTTKNMNGWTFFQSPGSQLEVITVPAKIGYGKELDYTSPGSGQAWFGLKKSVEGHIKKTHRFTLNIKGSGLKTTMEFKLITADGAVFGKKLEYLPYDDQWHEVAIAANELSYWWGGQGSPKLDYIDHIELVFTTELAGSGKIAVNHLRAFWR